MQIGKEIQVHEIIPEQIPFEGEEIAEDQPEVEVEREEEKKELETVE